MNPHHNQPAPDCVPDNVDDGMTAELGYGGYTSWSAQPVWPDTSEMLIQGDFDLSAIPPLEIGTTLPDQPSGYDAEGYDGEETPYPLASDPNAYPEPGSEQDPFASLFSNYSGLTW